MRILKIAGILLCLVGTLIAISAWPGRAVYWKEPAQIQTFLLAQTPLGTSRVNVVEWLKREGVTVRINDAAIPANQFGSGWPAASSFVNGVLSRYAVGFRTYVEATYLFDGDQRLVHVAVRKTVDSF